MSSVSFRVIMCSVPLAVRSNWMLSVLEQALCIFPQWPVFLSVSCVSKGKEVGIEWGWKWC